MKRFFAIAICMFLSIILFSQDNSVSQANGVIFQEISLQEALRMVQEDPESPKLVFVDCYTEWCGPCKYMTNNVFALKECGEFFNANFVNLKFDMEKGEGLEIAKKYLVSVYPTFLILDAEGKEINRVIGSDVPSRFIEKVSIAMDPSNSPSAKLQAYENEKSSENLFAYVTSLRSAYMNDQLNSFINNVFFTLEPAEMYNDAIWSALTSPTGELRNTNSDIFKYLITNRFEAEEYIPKTELDDFLLKTLKYFFMSYISGNLPQEIHAAYERNIICANALFTNDFGMKYLVRMATLKSMDKRDELFSMLDYRLITKGTTLDTEMIEKSFLQIKDLTPVQKSRIVKYLEDKQAALGREAEYAKRWTSRFQ